MRTAAVHFFFRSGMCVGDFWIDDAAAIVIYPPAFTQ